MFHDMFHDMSWNTYLTKQPSNILYYAIHRVVALRAQGSVFVLGHAALATGPPHAEAHR